LHCFISFLISHLDIKTLHFIHLFTIIKNYYFKNSKINVNFFKTLKYQEKSITPVDEYDSSKLSMELVQLAFEELGETDEIREAAITEMREWAMNNNRIEKLRLDTSFLIRYLRFKKYNIPLAQDDLERYLILRKYKEDGVYMMQHFDYRAPGVSELINRGLV
jgi:hypothetical protein